METEENKKETLHIVTGEETWIGAENWLLHHHLWQGTRFLGTLKRTPCLCCFDCGINDMNETSCSEFRMTLHLGLVTGRASVIPNWYLIFAIPNIRIGSYKKWHACRIIVSSSGLNSYWKQSLQ